MGTSKSKYDKLHISEKKDSTDSLTDKRVQEISAIYEISQAFDTISIDTLLKLITRKAAEVMDAQVCSLMLKPSDKDGLVIQASYGLSAEIVNETHIAFGEGVAGKVAQTGKPILLNDLQDDPMFRDSDIEARPEIVSSISVPFRDEESNVQGVLSIARRYPAVEFNQDDVKVFSVFASQAALAISKAKLYSTLKERVKELSSLYQAGRSLSTAYTQEEAAKTLMNVASRISGGLPSMLFLWESHTTGKLQFSCGVSDKFCEELSDCLNKQAIVWMTDNRKPRTWLLENLSRRIEAIAPVAEKLSAKFSWASFIPLVSEDSVIGMLLICAKSGRRLEQRRIRMISILASQAATIARNACAHANQIHMEREMRRVSELAAVGELAANIAHEIRNPLSSIKGAAQFLRKEYYDHQSLAEFLDIIIEEVNVLNTVTTDFLDYARPARLNIKKADINKIIQRTLQFMQMELNRPDVEVSLDLHESISQIYIDERQIEQALRNIMLNSMQAMQNGGHLRIASGEVDGGVLISISDTGCGISDDVLHHVFEPFFTTKTKGTGIGLAIVYKIVDHHRGNISIKSEVGSGTTLVIFLPANKDWAKAETFRQSRLDEVDLFHRSQ